MVVKPVLSLFFVAFLALSTPSLASPSCPDRLLNPELAELNEAQWDQALGVFESLRLSRFLYTALAEAFEETGVVPANRAAWRLFRTQFSKLLEKDEILAKALRRIFYEFFSPNPSDSSEAADQGARLGLSTSQFIDIRNALKSLQPLSRWMAVLEYYVHLCLDYDRLPSKIQARFRWFLPAKWHPLTQGLPKKLTLTEDALSLPAEIVQFDLERQLARADLKQVVAIGRWLQRYPGLEPMKQRVAELEIQLRDKAHSRVMQRRGHLTRAQAQRLQRFVHRLNTKDQQEQVRRLEDQVKVLAARKERLLARRTKLIKRAKAQAKEASGIQRVLQADHPEYAQAIAQWFEARRARRQFEMALRQWKAPAQNHKKAPEDFSFEELIAREQLTKALHDDSIDLFRNTLQTGAVRGTALGFTQMAIFVLEHIEASEDTFEDRTLVSIVEALLAIAETPDNLTWDQVKSIRRAMTQARQKLTYPDDLSDAETLQFFRAIHSHKWARAVDHRGAKKEAPSEAELELAADRLMLEQGAFEKGDSGHLESALNSVTRLFPEQRLESVINTLLANSNLSEDEDRIGLIARICEALWNRKQGLSEPSVVRIRKLLSDWIDSELSDEEEKNQALEPLQSYGKWKYLIHDPEPNEIVSPPTTEESSPETGPEERAALPPEIEALRVQAENLRSSSEQALASDPQLRRAVEQERQFRRILETQIHAFADYASEERWDAIDATLKAIFDTLSVERFAAVFEQIAIRRGRTLRSPAQWDSESQTYYVSNLIDWIDGVYLPNDIRTRFTLGLLTATEGLQDSHRAELQGNLRENIFRLPQGLEDKYIEAIQNRIREGFDPGEQTDDAARLRSWLTDSRWPRLSRRNETATRKRILEIETELAQVEKEEDQIRQQASDVLKR